MTQEPTNDPAPQTDPTAGVSPAPEPKFSQADIDRAVKERLERERKKFADYDDLKTKAQKMDELEAASKSETEKLAEKLAKAEQSAKEITARANERLKRAAILTKASGEFIDPEDVVTALASKVELNDEGEVEGLDEALKALKAAKPHWLKTEKGAPRLNAGNPANPGQGETREQARNRIFGGASDVFDFTANQSRDGGVFMNPGNPKQQP